MTSLSTLPLRDGRFVMGIFFIQIKNKNVLIIETKYSNLQFISQLFTTSFIHQTSHDMNFPILALAALVPLVVGAAWYSPMLFANAWMKETKLTEADLKGSNMAVIFGVTYVLSFMAAIFIMTVVIHQISMGGVFQGEPGIDDPNSPASLELKALMDKYGDRFRTFKHGALHGTITALFFVLPIVAVGALFERKSWKYIFIHVGYWVVSLALMGGIICQFA